MGDIANMTDSDGRVHGQRLLRWLRSRAEMSARKVDEWGRAGQPLRAAHYRGMLDLALLMADDLEREIAPPDYPGEDDDTVGPGDKDTGPCEGCGRLAHRVPVQYDGRVWLACTVCAAQVEDDTVDMDDPALKGGPEEERRS